MMLVFNEKVLVGAISRECYRSSAETRESAFETVISREGASIPPLLPVEPYISKIPWSQTREESHARAHGSLAGMPDDCTNLRVSKPVTLGRGVGDILLCCRVSGGYGGLLDLIGAYTDPISVLRPRENIPGAQLIEDLI